MNDRQQDQKQDQADNHDQTEYQPLLIDQLQRGLNDVTDGLDMAMQSRLRRMRAQAVDAIEHPSLAQRLRACGQAFRQGWMTRPVMQGAAFASVTTLAMSLWLMPAYQTEPEHTAAFPVNSGNTAGSAHRANSLNSSNADIINTTVRQETETEVNEMDVLMSNEDMDFLENLEVYEWLEAEYG